MKKWSRNFSNAPRFKSDAYYKVIVKDLEEKNRVLHKCSYMAHRSLVELLTDIDRMEVNQVSLAIDDIRRGMEKILMGGPEEKVTLALPDSEIVT
jgi:hypothetical protein